MKIHGPLFLLTFAFSSLVLAATPNTVRPVVPAAAGFRAEFLVDLNDVQKKIVSLAEAIPAEKYTWRPSAEVRSISEVYMHIAGSNYFLTSFVGAEAPQREDDLERSVTKKAEVVAELNRSFHHLRTALSQVNDLDTPVRMLGNKTTHRGVLVTTLNHLHEHLGQLIVYSRMNGIVPPWSREER